jgi:pseudaminic acid cytidylyltransferase
VKVAIIPARGGSKRILGKNIKDFFGKPVIAYSIEAAMASGCFDKIIVSTDDEQIASVAKACGAEVPFIRPSDIADDFATTGQVLKHAVQWCQTQGFQLDLVCCIYACSPFIAPTKIREAMELLKANPDAYFCFPVCEFPFLFKELLALIMMAVRPCFSLSAFPCDRKIYRRLTMT